jgi:methyltransferase (TIGR00027 family)
MEEGKPSRTAFGAATHRATHLIVDQPPLFSDPYAVTILGPEAVERMKTQPDEAWAASTRPMRAGIVARLLLAEGTLAKAVERGVTQYVVLGAGLDTFAYRNPWPQVRVFEVDYPATGEWKQQSLTQASIPIPGNVTYAGINFERETLTHGLERAGFDLTKPAVFAWLGVIPYLTREAIEATLAAVGSLPAGTEIIFDYGEPRESLPEIVQERMKERMAALAAIGEPWISFFAPSEMEAMLRKAGFSEVEDLAGADINARWYVDRQDGLRAYPMAHVLRARV